MVGNVGAPYDMYYLGAYTNANLEIHATLASAFREDNKDKDARRDNAEAITAVLLDKDLVRLQVGTSAGARFG
jgi:hypothetical protein